MNGGFHRPELARAVRRAGAARAAMRKRRRRSLVLAIGLPLTAAISFGVWTANASGIDVVQAASQHARDLVDLLNQRSPGARTAAELTKTKHAFVAQASDRVSRSIAGRPASPFLAKPLELVDLLSPPPD